MPRRLELSDADTIRQIWELQRVAYAVEAELIGYDGIPPLHESPAELRVCGESFLGVDDEAGLAGAVSWTRPDDGTLNICRLVVHPRAHRSGIATSLLNALDALESAERTVVSTGTANIPALALYRNRGFVPTGEQQIAPGITTTQLTRPNGVRTAAQQSQLVTAICRHSRTAPSSQPARPPCTVRLDHASYICLGVRLQE